MNKDLIYQLISKMEPMLFRLQLAIANPIPSEELDTTVIAMFFFCSALLVTLHEDEALEDVANSIPEIATITDWLSDAILEPEC